MDDHKYTFLHTTTNSLRTFESQTSKTFTPASCRRLADLESNKPITELVITEAQGVNNITFTFGERGVQFTNCIGSTAYLYL